MLNQLNPQLLGNSHVNSNGRMERLIQLSPYGLLLLTQPLHSSEQHIRANLEFSSNFGNTVDAELHFLFIGLTYNIKESRFTYERNCFKNHLNIVKLGTFNQNSR